MKRFLLAVALMLAMAGTASAAAVCVPSSCDKTPGEIIYAVAKCTAHTDNSLVAAIPTETMECLDGSTVYRIGFMPTTGIDFTSDSDAAISDEVGFTPLTAAGNGLNLVDNGDKRNSVPEDTGGNDWYYPVSKENTMTLTVTGNSVASAEIEIFFVSYLLVNDAGKRK